ncbi:Uncharacterised protein [Vibrio cholerae]|nr:Uncharacterised protein [Vibrio cholerae]CSI66943.1 Uncharacterised protein [Vibrio cholerae]
MHWQTLMAMATLKFWLPMVFIVTNQACSLVMIGHQVRLRLIAMAMANVKSLPTVHSIKTTALTYGNTKPMTPFGSLP